MQNGSPIVDIATRRRIGRTVAGGSRSIARIAADVVAGLRINPRYASPGAPLSLTLEDLTGVDDSTIRDLTKAVSGGVLTAASAARLAMRHAQEIGGSLGRPMEPTLDHRRSRSIELRTVGDPFDEFALRIGPTQSGLVVGFATFDHLDELALIYPRSDHTICIVAGRNAEKRSVAGVFATRDCPPALRRIGSSKKWRFAEHVIVLGGAIPRSDRRRRTMIVKLEEALAMGGIFAPIPASTRSHEIIGPDTETDILVDEALRLIEIAFPGIVRGRASRSRAEAHSGGTSNVAPDRSSNEPDAKGRPC